VGLFVAFGPHPQQYLGIPIHISKLRKQDMQVINEKMGRRLILGRED
jgi:hypothetical protein